MFLWPRRTPGSVSTSTSRRAACCTSAKRRICAWANLMSSITWAGRLCDQRVDLAGRQAESGGSHLSNFADNSRTAASPRGDDILEDRLDGLAHLAVGFEFFGLARAVLEDVGSWLAPTPRSSRHRPPATCPSPAPRRRDARNTTAPIRSSTVPSRPSLIRRSTSSWNARSRQNGRVSGVSIKVGPIEFTRMPQRREIDRHRLGQALDAVLGHAIHGASRAADMAHLRRHVDDRAAAPGLHHPARHRLSNEKRRTLVQAGDGVVVVLGHIQEAARPIGARVVHQHIERLVAMRSQRAPQPDRSHPAPTAAACRPRHGSPPAAASISAAVRATSDDMCAGLGQRRRAADRCRGRPGHQRALPSSRKDGVAAASSRPLRHGAAASTDAIRGKRHPGSRSVEMPFLGGRAGQRLDARLRPRPIPPPGRNRPSGRSPAHTRRRRYPGHPHVLLHQQHGHPLRAHLRDDTEHLLARSAAPAPATARPKSAAADSAAAPVRSTASPARRRTTGGRGSACARPAEETADRCAGWSTGPAAPAAPADFRPPSGWRRCAGPPARSRRPMPAMR